MRGARETDPRNLWIPEEVVCRLQEGIPSRNSGTTQERCLQERTNPGWVPKKNGRRPQRDEPPCTTNESRQEDAPLRDSGKTHERQLQAEHDSQRNHSQERSHQGQHGTRNLETTDVRMETSAAMEMQRGQEKPRHNCGLRRNSTLWRCQRPLERQKKRIETC
jgi:hypothetical protein